ncbi:DUF5994 family protein [Nocardioides sp. CFH 31398]|uniref:DUF5994 family protein n=1 Tax=Nocardioides sp. CFH 31398 TaxID=2919579 RepID=UPI001F05635F|nr:DUF5994 family protein [Nocardioides sp. CFH 31398]MCH1866216.1 DUF5994 family protein [Nocardioides sp. CFH 31398]
MTTSPSERPATTVAPRTTGAEGLRIAVRAPVRGTPLEGAWHPRSRDLAVEAADLVDHFPAEAGRPARLLFSRPDWNAEPGVRSLHRVRAARGPVKVGSFPSDDTHLMVVRLSPDRALRLLVVPSDVDEARGRRILERAAAPDNQLSASELLALD